jgi:hypothetical protein
MRVYDLFENDSDGFRKDLLKRVKDRVAQMHSDTAIKKAQNPDTWKFNKGDQVYSKKTGKTYTITNLYYDSKRDRAMYYYSTSDGGRGTFYADLADKSLIKLNEAATAGATSSANVATLGINPAISPGPARGKRSYTGSPGKSGTKSPPQPKVKQPKTRSGTAVNALDMPGTNLFGGPPLKR